MAIYIDDDFKCHTENDGTYTELTDENAIPIFDGKCKQFIEGYRCIPDGKVWIRDDGAMFQGLMIAPLRDSEVLEDYQAVHDDLARAYESEIAEYIEMIFEADLSLIESFEDIEETPIEESEGIEE